MISSNKENTRIAIMGFGNPCRSDDAIGCYVIEQLRKEFKDSENISLFDMGTSAFEVLFQLEGHQVIRIVDAVINTNEAPGTLYKVPANEIHGAIQDDPMVFLHSMKWDQALSYAKKILRENFPDDIQVYLIAVDNLQFEVELSEAVQAAGDKVVELIKEELNVFEKSI
ncbi:hydrogenase maturation protease [Arcicella rigui]|uniref:Hydrogenase maturation protease n=1 Tax=Arcicella rigui TaxID=797020 RepID=A0ABU5Q8D8_9BACT|nr:hydrogenase maturation protease [Arcicella rigui]MEA5138654.1 hydrogenase maturation protease [Arcicella rigui]